VCVQADKMNELSDKKNRSTNISNTQANSQMIIPVFWEKMSSRWVISDVS
jgi:hypothetical protein